ncbi:16S rRNA (cytosine(1402)-N(4))-methyltransferase RsmH [Auritidibacter ignavus]|uniref:16S rRNA (cytosine(1402)-N(4))-methyltransferase RsmH n=1 Tax=Auritidibacter ignavus TaxID=678932 RepID=UPI002108458A|nr:16S rRNA (cytosine(1402)-N(4))-methyltransferase RsmH [Auritidibacter ignavus]
MHHSVSPDENVSRRHTPVMIDRVVSYLNEGLAVARSEKRHPVVIDATLGMGGHTHRLLCDNPDLTIIGIDRDTQALQMAQQRLGEFSDRLVSFHGTYDEISAAIQAAETQLQTRLDGVAGILFDLGVSSYQLDEPSRGFAYSYDAPLDMRMDPTDQLTAADVVNTYSEADLERVLRNYGDEKFARRIATEIVKTRLQRPYRGSKELVETIIRAIPAAAAHRGSHPAKRTFQALRVEVNHELEVLTRAIPAAMAVLTIGARMVVMSYQSLEDKIVKKAIQHQAQSLTPAGFPVEVEEYAPVVKILSKGTEKPTPTEIEQNPRAAAARVRVIEKIRPTRSNG